MRQRRLGTYFCGDIDLTDESQGDATTPTKANSLLKKWPVLLVIAAIVVAYFQFGEYLHIDYLAERESDLRDFQSEHPWLVYGIAFGIYAVATGLSLPVAAFMSLILAWYFGFWRGLLIISFGSTLGATIAFLFSRYLMREAIQTRFAGRLKTFNEALDHEGAFYLFTLRLIPAVPFWAINVVMGVTRIPLSTYWWVSQLGMLPGTAVYTYAGSSVPSLMRLKEEGINAVFTSTQMIQITTALVLLGVFPLIVKKAMQRSTSSKKTAKEESTQA